MKRLIKLASTRGIISILMIISLFMPWFKWWVVSNSMPYLSAFSIARNFGLMWLAIILVFVLLVICILNIDENIKDKIYGVFSATIFIVSLLSKFSLVDETFKSTRIGWLLMLVLCVVHILISAYHINEDN